MKIEYRVRPVTRYVVTRYTKSHSNPGGRSEVCGEYDNEIIAQDIGRALYRDALAVANETDEVVYSSVGMTLSTERQTAISDEIAAKIAGNKIGESHG